MVFIRDSGGCAHIVSDVAESLLARPLSKLPKDDGVRLEEVRRVVEAYRPALQEKLEATSALQLDDTCKLLRTICMHLENLHLFSFQDGKHLKADRRSSQRTFDQATPDAIEP